MNNWLWGPSQKDMDATNAKITEYETTIVTQAATIATQNKLLNSSDVQIKNLKKENDELKLQNSTQESELQLARMTKDVEMFSLQPLIPKKSRLTPHKQCCVLF